MKTRPVAVALLIIAALLSVGLMAGETTPAPAKEGAEDGPRLAVYKVPNLTNDLSGSLIKSLTKVQGILSAKPDTDAGSFSVTFEPGRTTPEQIQAAMAQVAPGTELDKVEAADPAQAKKDCGKCPSRSKCSKSKG